MPWLAMPCDASGACPKRADGLYPGPAEDGEHRVNFRSLTPSLALMALLPSCSNGIQDAPFEECPGDEVSVTVSVGLSPTISWAPGCGMSSLDVFPSAGGSSLWVLYSGGQAVENPLHSGIRYGGAPAGALDVTGPMRLTVGTEYTVILYRSVGARVQAGVATFRP